MFSKRPILIIIIYYVPSETGHRRHVRVPVVVDHPKLALRTNRRPRVPVTGKHRRRYRRVAENLVRMFRVHAHGGVPEIP